VVMVRVENESTRKQWTQMRRQRLGCVCNFLSSNLATTCLSFLLFFLAFCFFIPSVKKMEGGRRPLIAC
jgi:hypothetical protein